MSPERRNRILLGDVRDRLRTLPEQSVDCVITSPPYFQLRDYGMRGQLGLEPTIEEWSERLREVLTDIDPVLKPQGSVWLNLGDSYSRDPRSGVPRKSLLLGPERLALKLLADGWIVRNKIVWAKTNPLPSGVHDRLASTWEVLYLLTRRGECFFDLDAIREPHRTQRKPRRAPRPMAGIYPPPEAAPPSRRSDGSSNRSLADLNDRGQPGHPLGKNPGDVWPIGTASFHGAHFATFPRKLIERPLLAGCPERVCAGCGRPWQREPMHWLGQLAVRGSLRQDCRCQRGWQPGLVLDPFLGSGTVALMAIAHRRDWLGIELNPDYAAIAEQRILSARLDAHERGP